MASETNELQEDGTYVALTHDSLNAQSIMDRVRSPQAGAIVLFAGEPSYPMHVFLVTLGYFWIFLVVEAYAAHSSYLTNNHSQAPLEITLPGSQ